MAAISNTAQTAPDARRLHELNLLHVAVLNKHLSLRKLKARRDSTGSILQLTASSASPAAGNAMDKEDQRYEEMMERFQIRRLQPNASGDSDGHNTSIRKFRRGSIPAVYQPNQIDVHGSPMDARSDLPEPSVGPLSRPPSKDGRMRGSLLDTRATVVDLSISANGHQRKGSSIATADVEHTKMGKLEKLYFESTSLRWVFVAWKRKLSRRCRRALRRIKQPMSPFSLIFRVRIAVLVVGFFVHVVCFPVSLAFADRERSWTYWVDYWVELAFLADFLLMFNTSFLNTRNELIASRREIFVNYVTGWGIPDLISSIPLHSLQAAIDHDTSLPSSWTVVVFDCVLRVGKFVHLLKIMRLLWIVRPNRTGKSIWDWLLYSRYSHLVRIGFIVGSIVLIAHYMACAWRKLTLSSADSEDAALHEIYASSFYDALQLLQGQGVATVTLEQNVFASCAVLVGSIVLAIVFGHVAVLVSNFNANSTNYQRKMESVFAVMTKMQLPAPLRERIHQYYEHLWREYESLDSEIGRFSKDLSHSLELEVVLFKYMELIMHIPFWKACTPVFQKQLMLNLRVRVYLPDDFIIRRGEVGDEFYMINHGSCELATGPDSLERATGPLKKKKAARFSDFADFMGTTMRPKTSNEEDDDESSSDSDADKRRQFRAKRSIYQTESFDDDDDDMHPVKSARVLKKLSRGQAFGEMALLTNYQRTANVRAITYVEMCVLNRSDFHRILSRYPDDRKHVTLHMLTNCMEKTKATKCTVRSKKLSALCLGATILLKVPQSQQSLPPRRSRAS